MPFIESTSKFSSGQDILDEENKFKKLMMN
jgi:hypothetical protein